MNFSIIVYIIGYVLKIEGFLMLIPTLVGQFYGESEYLSFLAVAVGILVLGHLISFKKPNDVGDILK